MNEKKWAAALAVLAAIGFITLAMLVCIRVAGQVETERTVEFYERSIQDKQLETDTEEDGEAAGETASNDEQSAEPVTDDKNSYNGEETANSYQAVGVVAGIEETGLRTDETASYDGFSYYEAPSETTYASTSGLTPESGVNYYNGNRETYYSSNVLYHYRTPEWTAGADGVYRDSDGYVVVASSDLAQGSVLDTSLGAAKVYDTGCASGTVDVYVNW